MKTHKYGICLPVAAGVFLFASQAIAGTCHLGKTWQLVQDNGFKVTLDMLEDGDILSGTATTRGMGGTSNLSGEKTGYADFEFTINWANGSIGNYNGRVNKRKFAKGTTNGVAWHSLDTFTCD